MNLFPQSKEWVLNELIDPTTNTVTPHLNFINKSLTRECEVFINYSYRDLVDGFNNFLRCPNIDDDEYDDDEYDECLICYNEIKSIVKFGILLFKSGYYFKLEMSCFDVCALLLICKKLTEENMITVENPEDFIELILNELDNPIFSLLEDELYNPTLFEGEIDYSYIADFISYYDVLNNDLMTDYFYLHDSDNHLSLNSMLNGGKYSYLFLNDEYKKLTYEGICLDALNYLDDCIINNSYFIKDLCKYNPEALSYRNEWSSDREVVLEVVKNFGGALEYASQDLKSDREVVLAAVKNNGYALEFASEDLRFDREVVLEVVKNDEYALRYASKDLRSDREFILEVIKNFGRALQYASEDLKSDRELVLAAVKNFGRALEYASEDLRSDREIVFEAVNKGGAALEYASEDLRSDSEVVLAAVKNFGGALKYASEDLRSDREVVLAAVKNFGSVLQYASEDLKSDREVVLAAVKNNGYALEYASEALRSEREVVLVAVKQTAEYDVNDSYLRSAFKYCSNELSNDIEFIIESSKIDIKTIGLVDSDLISKHSELQTLYEQYKLKVDNI